MNRKNLLAAALAAGSLMGIASVAQAVPAVVATPGTYATPQVVYGVPGQTIVVQTAPPAPVHEVMPAAREGYIWSPGHYVWQDGRYMWQGGQWIASRPGYAWQAAHWEQRGDGSWMLVSGHWVRTDNVAYERRMERGPNGDMDHDGIRNADDDDRDGDGIANWRDDFPNNRNRS